MLVVPNYRERLRSILLQLFLLFVCFNLNLGLTQIHNLYILSLGFINDQHEMYEIFTLQHMSFSAQRFNNIRDYWHLKKKNQQTGDHLNNPSSKIFYLTVVS